MSKQPQAVLDTIFAFSPNRDTLGATAYLIVENRGNILIDSPALDDTNLEFLQQQGGVKGLFITHRGAIGKAEKLSQILGCEVIISEQEAYLLPETKVTTFREEYNLSETAKLIWTPGHSPGSSCLYHSSNGGVLFTGRHIIPNQKGEPVPLKTSKTFHWPRQLQNVQKLLNSFSADTLSYICPGANTGYLRGQKAITSAYERLAIVPVGG
ncbi:MBL fold metallo-hydrolase [Ancylothrix sp. C2]|uniref:MBL fold metallo-hydrolase n=1 Tax=Ancylothrix sp. D3o TaxID=2953691 RepID=UPI0021BBA003|nr:MBL fold metallo-hydrolase [Ancylothrix sp. D3o]MCT7948536.1 MBL fold metallo-hydrolase [Ancylothrix sp. D3o]